VPTAPRTILATVFSTALAAGLLGAGGSAAIAAEADAARQWVALGDSYTAGVFAGEQLEPRDGCLRTSEAYPAVVAASTPSVDLTANVSCSSATIDNIWEAQKPPFGEELVPPQLDALNADTEVVTIGIGGNSMGFAEIMGICLIRGAIQPEGTPCTASYKADPANGSIGEALETKLNTVTAQYRVMLDSVRAAAPKAQIVTVGYPQITPPDWSTCTAKNPQQFSTMALRDIPFFRLVEERMNEGVAAATADAGATFVDTYEISAGKDVCADADERFIEGIKLADGSDAFIHPNSRGHAATAAAVATAIG